MERPHYVNRSMTYRSLDQVLVASTRVTLTPASARSRYSTQGRHSSDRLTLLSRGLDFGRCSLTHRVHSTLEHAVSSSTRSTRILFRSNLDALEQPEDDFRTITRRAVLLQVEISNSIVKS